MANGNSSPGDEMAMTPQAVLRDLLDRVESGEIRILDFDIENELGDEPGGRCRPLEFIPTGRKTIRVRIEKNI